MLEAYCKLKTKPKTASGVATSVFGGGGPKIPDDIMND